MKQLDSFAPCPCGRLARKSLALRYADCCGPCLESGLPAKDAESLMRSRYAAFVLEREDYLLRSWHASCRPASLEFEPQAKWLGLEVRRVTLQDANHAEVEFVARQRLPGGAHRLHECSRFVREDGQWYYLNGDAR